MKLQAPEKVTYQKAAGSFLKAYYENNGNNSISYMYRFTTNLAGEAKHIAKSIHLRGMDYQNAIVATWFRYAGISDVAIGQSDAMKQLLVTFFAEVNYPEDDQLTVINAITAAAENKYAETKVQEVVSDAVNSQLADQSFLQNILHLKEEVNRLSGIERTEIFYAKYFLSLMVQVRYYTGYAVAKYSFSLQNNFKILEKRVFKLDETEKVNENIISRVSNNAQLTGKETEDLFKIAFRNYNHLVSVADSKAALLINVNSIIISVMLAFVLSKVEKNMFLLYPTILLLCVCMGTILLGVLASRPQKNSFSGESNSHSYQKFFFGSFDLIDPGFRAAGWNEYAEQLNELFNNTKENVYMELFKEAFNVRKVLSKKFNYLSLAYWVFMLGLLVSIIAFVVSIAIVHA